MGAVKGLYQKRHQAFGCSLIAEADSDTRCNGTQRWEVTAEELRTEPGYNRAQSRLEQFNTEERWISTLGKRCICDSPRGHHFYATQQPCRICLQQG